MELLNDVDSTLYKDTLEKQIKYISNRLVTIRNRYIDDPVGLCGTKEIIAKHLNKGPAQNLIHTFFKYTTDKCMVCNKSKNDEGVRQFERAHCNNYSRYDLLLLAVNDLYVDENTPIKSGDILRLFIKKHTLCPIYILCNICHNKYDSRIL